MCLCYNRARNETASDPAHQIQENGTRVASICQPLWRTSYYKQVPDATTNVVFKSSKKLRPSKLGWRAMGSKTKHCRKTVFCRRLKEARQAAGISQKNLGIAAGIDEFVASTRINRYEQGVHEADVVTTMNLAKALGVPSACFYAGDDRLARMVLVFSTLPTREQDKLLRQLEAKAEKIGS
jgi:transcriptional regulator with XRE-family HTH domain